MYVSQIVNLLMVYFVVIISTPPENTTACRGSNVTISCKYLSGPALPVTWIINGTSFDEASLMNSPLYQLNDPTTPLLYTLTVFYINHTTTFQCVVHATNRDMRPTNIPSTLGTVTVIGMYLHFHSSYVACFTCTYNYSDNTFTCFYSYIAMSLYSYVCGRFTTTCIMYIAM